MTENIVKWLPLIVALVAGIFALSQVKSNNITNARLKWLEQFKQIITEFLAESTMIQLKEGVTSITGSDADKQYFRDLNNKLIDSYYEHLRNIQAKLILIKLNLNPKEEIHIIFMKTIDDYMKLFNKLPITKENNERSELLKNLDLEERKLISIIQCLIKLEWEKTKKNKVRWYFYSNFGKGKNLLNETHKINNP